MKIILSLLGVLALSLSGFLIAQPSGMSDSRMADLEGNGSCYAITCSSGQVGGNLSTGEVTCVEQGATMTIKVTECN